MDEHVPGSVLEASKVAALHHLVEGRDQEVEDQAYMLVGL
jgi:hypothetical protein